MMLPRQVRSVLTSGRSGGQEVEAERGCRDREREGDRGGAQEEVRAAGAVLETVDACLGRGGRHGERAGRDGARVVEPLECGREGEYQWLDIYRTSPFSM